MKNSKKSIILAVSLVVAGLIIGAAGLFAVNFDFPKLSLSQPTTNTHSVEGDFTCISIDTDISDVRLEVSQDDTCQVVCQEEANCFHTVSVENYTLTITMQDNRMWYEHIGMHFGNSHSITVYLPKKAYEELTVNCDTADVEIPKGFSFGHADIATTTGDIKWQGSMVNNLLISVSTGDVLVDDTGCQNLTAKTTTGDIRLSHTIITQNLTVKTTTGDVRFDRSDAHTMDIKTTTGDVTGTLLSYKRFTVITDTGTLRLPPMADNTDKTFVVTDETGKVLSTGTSNPGPCNIRTTTGDVHIALS